MSSSQISESEQEQLIEKLEVFKIKGKDKQGRKILRIVGKFFPGNYHEFSKYIYIFSFFVSDLFAEIKVFLFFFFLFFWLICEARMVSVDVLRKFLEERIFPRLGKEKPFSVVYLHSGVQRSENFPGISALRAIYEAIPIGVRENLEAVYFVHPGLQSRLFLATFGRFLFTGG